MYSSLVVFSKKFKDSNIFLVGNTRTKVIAVIADLLVVIEISTIHSRLIIH